MAFRKTGGFSGGQPPIPLPSGNTTMARDGFSGGRALTKSFSGGSGQITTAQLQAMLPQGAASSVMSPQQTTTPAVPTQASTTTTKK